MNQEENTNWLKKEVEDWKNKEIISEFQAQAILSLYGLAESPAGLKSAAEEDKQSGLITVVSVLGSLLVGIGAILFVASNWDKIPNALKFILLFGTTFATYFWGWKLKFKTPSYPEIGHILLFLASIFVGVTIF